VTIKLYRIYGEVIEMPSATVVVHTTDHMLLQMVTSIGNVVLVKDASDEDEIITDAQVIVKDPSFSSPSKIILPTLCLRLRQTSPMGALRCAGLLCV
jgi:hypothetical protein